MGLLLFEASLVATILVGEPLWVISTLIAMTLVTTQRVTDDVFFVFLGGVYASFIAHRHQYKTKSEDTLRNILEAITLVCGTCYILPLYASNEVRAAGSIFMYLIALEQFGTAFCVAAAASVATLVTLTAKQELWMVVAPAVIVLSVECVASLIKRYRSWWFRTHRTFYRPSTTRSTHTGGASNESIHFDSALARDPQRETRAV